jgi:hypothetical protein
VCASGSINQVIRGSHYNRAMRIHQHELEALERLLLEKFTSRYSFDIRQVDELKSLAVHSCYENCADVMENEDYISFTDQFQNFKQQVRNGQLEKTAQLWMNYCDSVWILLRFVEAVKENDLELYVNSMYAMSSLMFSSDHLNYARYLPMYYMQLKNLVEANEDAKELLGKYGISVSRSKVPACRNAIDVTIEQTINRSAKTTGGIVGFSRNVNAYYRWCLTRHKRATFMEATLECLNMSSTENDSHKTVRPSEIKRSEEDVQRLVNAFKNFMNPFDLPDFALSQLVCLSSGMPATSVVTEDMLKYISAGEAARNTFIQERILSTTVKFQDTLKKQRLHTFQSMAISKIVTTAKNKAVRIKAERNFIGQLLMLVNQQGKEIDFDRLFAYPLSPVPWSFATADGSLMKTNKAQLMHMLEEKLSQDRHEGEYEIPDDSTVIIDGNALLQSLTRLPETFGAFALTVFKCLPITPVVHFVTDSYHVSSIKQLERQRRGSSQKLIIGGPSTKLPKDFSSFMHNSDNKIQLISFLLREWQSHSYAKLLHNRTVYFVCEENCYSLSSVDGSSVTVSIIESLKSSHEEADTRIILHSLFAEQKHSGDGCLVIRSPDTDIFILLLAYAYSFQSTLLFDTGSGNNRRIIPIKDIALILGKDLVQALPAFHAFSGCDSTSAFVRKGKKGPFSILTSDIQFVNVFKQLGESIDSVSEGVLQKIEYFVCCMYGRSHETETAKVRSSIFQSRYGSKGLKSLSTASDIGIDMSLLPPCKSTLKKHIMRANYQAFLWEHAHIQFPEVKSPEGLGWFKVIDGALQIDWTDGDIMPQDTLTILESEDSNENTSEESSDTEETIGVDEEVDNILDIIFEDEDSFSI